MQKRKRFVHKILCLSSIGFLLLALCCLINVGLTFGKQIKNIDAVSYTSISSASGLTNMSSSGNYQLTTNITVTSTSWSPIEFSGIFDGGGYTITFSKATTISDCDYQGFFSLLESGGEIKNLTINYSGGLTFSYDGYIEAGGIVGENCGTVDNCHVKGTLKSSGIDDDVYIAGITGFNYGGTITNCSNSASITASASGYVPCAGIVGYNDGYINYCYNTGTISGTSTDGDSYVGGILAESSYGVMLENCYNTGGITGTSSGGSVYAGGIVGGSSYESFKNCYNSGTITAKSTSTGTSDDVYAGGIIGDGGKDIINCYNTVAITATSSKANAYAGGIVAKSGSGNCYNCYSTGTVKSTTSATSTYKYVYAGGIVGYSQGMIINCYNTGSISGTASSTTAYVGGIVGRFLYSVVVNSFSLASSVSASASTKYTGGIAGANENWTYVLNSYYSTSSSMTNTASLKGTYLSSLGSYLKVTSSTQTNFTNGYFTISSTNYYWHTSYPWNFYNVWQAPSSSGTPTLRLGNSSVSYTLQNITGSGTEDDPYLVKGLAGLEELAFVVNRNIIETSGKYFELVDNDGTEDNTITSTATTWVPIGSNYIVPFQGIFDGKGCELKFSNAVTTEGEYMGVFGYAVDATILDFGVDWSSGLSNNFYETMYSSGFVGRTLNTKIQYCYSKGDLSITSCTQQTIAGGIVAEGSGTILDSYRNGDISAYAELENSQLYVFCGGLAGNYTGTIANCYVYGNVSATAITTNSYEYIYIGGLSGASSTIYNSFIIGSNIETATSNISPQIKSSAIVQSGTATNCYYSISGSFSTSTGTSVSSLLSYLSTKANISNYTTGTSTITWNANYPWDFSAVWDIEDGVNSSLPIISLREPSAVVNVNITFEADTPIIFYIVAPDNGITQYYLTSDYSFSSELQSSQTYKFVISKCYSFDMNISSTLNGSLSGSCYTFISTNGDFNLTISKVRDDQNDYILV